MLESPGRFHYKRGGVGPLEGPASGGAMEATATLFDTLLPRRRAALGLLPAVGASLAIALAAQVAVPLPFTPVPLTLQTLAVLLASAALGMRRGALAVALYLAEGLAGLPVFASFSSGPAPFLGPTGGYLVGFLPAAAIVGALAE